MQLHHYSDCLDDAWPNFSVERMAAGVARLPIRALGARRHRSPSRWLTSAMRKNILMFWVLALMLVGCTPPQGKVRRSEVTAGPYELFYAKSRSEEIIILSRSNHNLLCTDGRSTYVFVDGRPAIFFERMPDNTLTNLGVRFFGRDWNPTILMLDTNADGEWDRKFDDAKMFVREGSQWVQREPSQPDGPANRSQPIRSETNQTSSAAGSGR